MHPGCLRRASEALTRRILAPRDKFINVWQLSCFPIFGKINSTTIKISRAKSRYRPGA